MSPDKQSLNRRSFLRTAAASSLLASAGPIWTPASLLPQAAARESERNCFTLARVIYQGGWNAAFPNSDRNLLNEFESQTGDRFVTDFVQLTMTDKRLFRYPVLYLTGSHVSGAFSERDAEMLRLHLSNGGFLFASDCGGGGRAFHDSVVRLIELDTFRDDSALVRLELDREDHPLLNLVVPFPDWSPGLYTPGRYLAWQYDGRLVAYLVSQFDHNCILAARASDRRITSQALWQSCNVLYYALTH